MTNFVCSKLSPVLAFVLGGLYLISLWREMKQNEED